MIGSIISAAEPIHDFSSSIGTFVNDLRVNTLPGRSDLGHSRISVGQLAQAHCPSIPAGQDRLGTLVGGTARMRDVYSLIRAAAPTQATVLVLGESGAGKELVAKTLHEFSGRNGPLVVFDASVADPEMIRNDLFGHVKGAFTGATHDREGAFRRADQGTLFLDEIGELPLDLQPRLLRALETREIAPIGSDQSLRVDVRIVAATHRNLEDMVRERRFRADLYYRLSVMQIEVPPLREIPEDIPLLVEHLRNELSIRGRLSTAAMHALQAYHWPGNVRELRNVLERAAVLGPQGEIGPERLNLPVAGPTGVDPSTAPATRFRDLVSPLKVVERKLIIEALEQNQNNISKTARELGIPLSTFKRKLKALQNQLPTTGRPIRLW